MKGTVTAALVAAALAAFGCGGDDDPPGAPDAAPAAIDAMGAADAEPSAGLTVIGTMQVENQATSEVDANHRGSMAVRVSRDGQPVTNAVVRINPAQSFQTTLTGEPLDPSLYTGWYISYNRTARIAINVGAESIPEATMVGQELFRVLEPNGASMVPGGMDLVVRWSRPGAAADVLRVTTDSGYDSGELADSDTHTIPGSAIVDNDVIVVFRWHRNALPGAAAGSQVDFGIATYMPITVDSGM
jgi:hypothetical protein